MMILMCLLDLVIYAMIVLFVLWVLQLVLGMFIGNVRLFPIGDPQPSGSPVITLLYLAIGLILLINFLLCAFGVGHTVLPPLSRDFVR